MRRAGVVLGLILVFPLVAACNSISSYEEFGPDARGVSSMAYMLPKAVVPIQLKEKDGRFKIVAQTPKYHGDPRHLYYLAYRPSVLASDELEATVEANGLLKTVNMTADDKTGQVLIDLAKSLGSLSTFAKENNLVDGMDIIDSVDVDPSDPDLVHTAEKALTGALRHRIRDRLRVTCNSTSASDAPLCDEYQALNENRPTVKLGFFPQYDSYQEHEPDCTIGVCFRLPIPYRITAGVSVGGDATVSSAIVALPNDGPIIATDFSRALFVQKVTNASFTNGVLTSLSVTKPSEAAGAVALPSQIIAAFFSGITETFGNRNAALQARISYAEKLKEFEQSKADKESSLQGAGDSLFSVGFGGGSAGDVVTDGKLEVVEDKEAAGQKPGQGNGVLSSPSCLTPPCPSQTNSPQ